MHFYCIFLSCASATHDLLGADAHDRVVDSSPKTGRQGLGELHTNVQHYRTTARLEQCP